VISVERDSILAWAAIGGAASLAGMIWPFRRGAVGVVVNVLSGVTGAILSGLLSYLFLPQATTTNNQARLFFAALGAIALLGVVHAAWTRIAERRRHAAQ
jgi:uncharacterized membrane protein YeaQ/YmgE (transglycosylase-associated protein family)